MNDELKPVNIRLFAGDVAKAKQQAAKAGLPWQVFVRLLVRDALKSNEKQRSIR